jgi:hypothetical protein
MLAGAFSAMYIHRMPKAMIRKQVYLTAELDDRLRREAKRQRRTEAEILREALAARLNATNPSGSDAPKDALWALVGIGASKETNLSERVDEVLYGAPVRQQGRTRTRR